MSKLEHLKFYVRKHGAIKCLQIALGRLRLRIFGQQEWLYVHDLASDEPPSPGEPRPESLASFTSAGQVDADTIAGLRRFKSEYALQQFLSRWFSRGAILWVLKKDGQVVAVQWTLEGGFGGFYSVPVLPGEVVIVAVEVFPVFRGQGIYPLMSAMMNRGLSQMGFTRAYLKVAYRNLPMQRSMAKTSYIKVARVYTRFCFGKPVTIWRVVSAGVGERVSTKLRQAATTVP